MWEARRGGVEPLSVDVLRGMRVVAALGAGTGFFTTSAVQAVQLSVHLGMHMSHFFFASCPPLSTERLFVSV